MNKRYYVDMDGVLAKYEFNLPSYEALYEEGYFLYRPPQTNIVEAAKKLNEQGREVFILSAVLKDSEYALSEKHEWLDRYLPLPCKQRIFTICGEDKISFIPAFSPDRDILIDDFGDNCRSWANQGGTYIKVSVNAEDAAYEVAKHRYVIHPEMSVDEIVAVIDLAATDMDAAFNVSTSSYDIEYREVYSKIYRDIKGDSYEDAVENLEQMIREGFAEGPELCDHSEFVDRTDYSKEV